MPTLLLLWHSQTGGTAQLVEACVSGARSIAAADLQVRALPAREANAADLLAADAVIFATPENLGSMSGLLKDYFDRCYYGLLDQVNGKPYASLICAGSDGSGALRQLERIASGLRLRRVAAPITVLTHAQSPAAILADKHIAADELARCHELGATLAAGLSMGLY